MKCFYKKLFLVSVLSSFVLGFCFELMASFTDGGVSGKSGVPEKRNWDGVEFVPKPKPKPESAAKNYQSILDVFKKFDADIIAKGYCATPENIRQAKEAFSNSFGLDENGQEKAIASVQSFCPNILSEGQISDTQKAVASEDHAYKEIRDLFLKGGSFNEQAPASKLFEKRCNKKYNLFKSTFAASYRLQDYLARTKAFKSTFAASYGHHPPPKEFNKEAIKRQFKSCYYKVTMESQDFDILYDKHIFQLKQSGFDLSTLNQAFGQQGGFHKCAVDWGAKSALQYFQKLDSFKRCINVLQGGGPPSMRGMVSQFSRRATAYQSNDCYSTKEYLGKFNKSVLWYQTLIDSLKWNSECIQYLEQEIGTGGDGPFEICQKEESITNECCSVFPQKCELVKDNTSKASFQKKLEGAKCAQDRESLNSLQDQLNSNADTCATSVKTCQKNCKKSLEDFQCAVVSCFALPRFFGTSDSYKHLNLSYSYYRLKEIVAAYNAAIKKKSVKINPNSDATGFYEAQVLDLVSCKEEQVKDLRIEIKSYTKQLQDKKLDCSEDKGEQSQEKGVVNPGQNRQTSQNRQNRQNHQNSQNSQNRQNRQNYQTSQNRRTKNTARQNGKLSSDQFTNYLSREAGNELKGGDAGLESEGLIGQDIITKGLDQMEEDRRNNIGIFAAPVEEDEVYEGPYGIVPDKVASPESILNPTAKDLEEIKSRREKREKEEKRKEEEEANKSLGTKILESAFTLNQKIEVLQFQTRYRMKRKIRKVLGLQTRKMTIDKYRQSFRKKYHLHPPHVDLRQRHLELLKIFCLEEHPEMCNGWKPWEGM